MGRILRKGSASGKSAAAAGGAVNAFFYTLISNDTLEVYFANKRRRYLVDQVHQRLFGCRRLWPVPTCDPLPLQGYAYMIQTADKLVDPASVPALLPLVEAQRRRQEARNQQQEKQLADERAAWTLRGSEHTRGSAFDLDHNAWKAEEAGEDAPEAPPINSGLASDSQSVAVSMSTPGMAWSSSLGMEALRRTASFATRFDEQIK